MRKANIKIGTFVYVPAHKMHGTIEGIEFNGGVRYLIIYFVKTGVTVKMLASEVQGQQLP